MCHLDKFDFLSFGPCLLCVSTRRCLSLFVLFFFFSVPCDIFFRLIKRRNNLKKKNKINFLEKSPNLFNDMQMYANDVEQRHRRSGRARKVSYAPIARQMALAWRRTFPPHNKMAAVHIRHGTLAWQVT